jgi:hypothetical protein
MGKTSLLQRLPRHLGPEVICVPLNCQGLGIGTDLASLLTEFAVILARSLTAAGKSAPEVDPAAFQSSPGPAFEHHFMPQLFAALGDQPMLWTFDELEDWVGRAQAGRLDPELFGFLRHIIERHPRLRVLIVGTQRLYSATVHGVSPLLNLAVTRRLGTLDEEAARRLVLLPLERELFWDDLAVVRLLRLTGGHPYFLQAACWVLVDHCLSQQRGFIGPQDVHAVEEEVWETCETHLRELWRELEPVNRLLLAGLTRLRSGQQAATPAELLSHLVTTYTLRPDPGHVLRALEQLAERQLLRRLEGERYTFLVPIFGHWVRETRSVGAVIEEATREIRQE